nr:hypothetical protein [Crenothrix polyspora]
MSITTDKRKRDIKGKTMWIPSALIGSVEAMIIDWKITEAQETLRRLTGDTGKHATTEVLADINQTITEPMVTTVLPDESGLVLTPQPHPEPETPKLKQVEWVESAPTQPHSDYDGKRGLQVEFEHLYGKKLTSNNMVTLVNEAVEALEIDRGTDKAGRPEQIRDPEKRKAIYQWHVDRINS